MGNAIFQSLPALEPPNRFSKKLCTVDYVGDPTPHANIWISRPKGDVSAHAWICHRQASIFFFFKVFFSFMRIAIGPPVGPIIAVNGLNDAFWWHSHSLYGLVKENWKLPSSAPQIWKFALQPTATLKSHNSGTVDTCKMFAPNRGFWGRAIKGYHLNFC